MTAKSKTAKYYASNPAAKKVKSDYQASYNKKKENVAKRVELNKINRENHASGKSTKLDGKDVSHLRGGGTTLEKESTNRARQGAGGKRKKK